MGWRERYALEKKIVNFVIKALQANQSWRKAGLQTDGHVMAIGRYLVDFVNYHMEP